MISETAQLLRNLDPSVRRAGAETMGSLVVHGAEREAVIAHLIDTLCDPHVGVQEAALEALLCLGGSEVARQMFSLVKRDDIAIRNLAIEGLQRLREAAIGVLVEAESDSNPHIRKIVAELLGQTGSTEPVDVLIRFLDDPCANVRASAAVSLGHLGHPAAVQPLLRTCHDEELWVRFSSVQALGAIGDSCALPTIQSFLDTKDLPLLCAVVEAIGKIGTTEDIPSLLEMLPMAGLPLRHYLFVTIVRLVGPDTNVFEHEAMKAMVFKELVAALHAREQEVQIAAIQGLRILNDSRATEPLLTMLGQSSLGGESELRDEIFKTLTVCGEESVLCLGAESSDERVALPCIGALSHHASTTAVSTLCDLIDRTDNCEVRLAALKAIHTIGIFNSKVIPVTLVALQDFTGAVREAAARIVESFKLTKAASILWSGLAVEQYPNVIEAHVKALLALDDQNTLGIFRDLLKHERAEVRQPAILFCSPASLTSMQGILLNCLSDEDWHVRLAVVERLTDPPNADLSPSLITALSDDHPYVRQAAVLALGAMGTSEAMNSLQTVGLHDPDVWVRTRTIEQLSHHRHHTFAPILITLLEDSVVPIQMAAIHAVEELGESRAIPVLRRLTQHGDSEVGMLASHALERLGDSSVCVVSG